jgi:hypothetical protein
MLISPKEHGMSDEQCQETKRVVSKYGVSVVCDEDEIVEKHDIVMSASENCENMKEVVGKYGVSVLCQE